MRQMALGIVMVFGLTMLGACSDDNGPTPGESIVIGAIFHDAVSESAKLRLDAIKMGIEEINASGAFESELKVVNRSPAVGDSADADKAADNAKKLHDDDKAVGVISLFSSVGKGIIGVTNTAPYSKFVQCNCSATSPTLNDDKDPDSDKNKAFYRTVVHDAFQGALMAYLIDKNGWGNIGIYYLDDAFGQGVNNEVKNYATDPGFPYTYTVALELKHPTGDFDVNAEKTNLDKIIADAAAGTIDVLILPTLKAQAPSIVKYLTENNYVGALILSDGAKTGDMFTIATGIKAWAAADPKNKIIGTEPDTMGGKNSATFNSAFKSKFGVDANTYSPTAYDCLYAIVFALLLSGDAELKPESVHTGIQSFINIDANVQAYDLGSAEFKKAADAIKAGDTINFEGASGRLVFADNGDRPRQSMREYHPNTAMDAWEDGQSYTPTDLGLEQ